MSLGFRREIWEAGHIISLDEDFIFPIIRLMIYT